MAVKSIPINGDILRWALDESGLDTKSFAQRVSVDESEVAAWISGDNKPNATRFKKIADVLNRPPSFFLRTRVPRQSDSMVALRVPYGQTARRELTPEERVEVRKASRLQKIARWAVGDDESDSVATRLPQINHSTAERAASTVGAWLQWDRGFQYHSRTSKAAVTKALRRRLEAQGILIVQYSLAKSIRGFSNYDSQVPLIAFNSHGNVPSARSYTILHELAHILHREDAACGAADNDHERWCDEFAAAVLMPRQDFLEFFHQNFPDRLVAYDDLDIVKKISNRFKASYQAVSLRLWNLDLSSIDLYRYVKSTGWQAEADKGFATQGQRTPEIRLREFGTTYPRILFGAYSDRKITFVDLRKYLDVNGDQLRELMQIVSAEAE